MNLGCFLSTENELRSYEHPKNKVTAEPAMEEEIWGATFKVYHHSHHLSFMLSHQSEMRDPHN